MQFVKFVANPLLSHDAFLLQGVGTKVEQDGQAQAGGGEIIMRLGFVPGVQLGDGFDLQDDLAFDDEVSFVFAHQDAFVVDWQLLELLEADATHCPVRTVQGRVSS